MAAAPAGGRRRGRGRDHTRIACTYKHTCLYVQQGKEPTKSKIHYPIEIDRVWLDRNPTTPTHVFVGDAPGLLPKIQAAAQRDPNSALVLVRPSRSHSSHSHAKDHAALLHRLGVAVLDGAVERVDPQTGVLLTRDERVILFDSLTVQWGGVRDRAGVEAAAAGLHDEDEDEDDKTQATKAHRPRGEIVRPEGKLVPASASAAAAASAAMQQGGKAGSGSSGAAASGCNRGCSRIVRRKSLHATGEGLHHIVASWRLSRTDTWPWCVCSCLEIGRAHV